MHVGTISFGHAAALLMATPRSVCPAMKALPNDIVSIHAKFYEPTAREKKNGAPERPTLAEVAPVFEALNKAFRSEDLAIRAAKQNPHTALSLIVSV